MTKHVLQDAGRIALAKALKAKTIHIALGRGEAAWDALTPAQIEASTPNNAAALVSEIGRRVATVQYVEPDPVGDIEVRDTDTDTTRRYRLSVNPTAFLYLRAKFDYTEGQGEYMREVGIYVDGTPIAGLPPGQMWFTAAQVATPGELYAQARGAASYRDGGSQWTEETVLPL